MIWQTITLGDMIELQRGYDLPEIQRRTGIVPVCGSAGINGYHDTARAPGPGVTVGRSGASIGVVTFLNEPYWPHNTVLFVRDFKGNDPRFVAAVLRQARLADLNSGSAQPSLNRNFVYHLPIKVPPLDVQRRIASILSTYDELFEVNTRQIVILEEMAQRLFDEWFVKFKFSRQEVIAFHRADGSIPCGWKRATLGQVVENYDRFRKPLSKQQRQVRQGPYPYYGAAKIFDYIDDYLFEGRYLLLAEDGSVITNEGYPVLQLTNGRFWANNHTHILRGIPGISTEFLYLALRRYSVSGLMTGAAQPKITQANMNRIPILVGSPEIHSRFDDVVHPLFDWLDILRKSNCNLCEQRDFLLPKLISGEIDLSQVEREEWRGAAAE